MYCRPTTKKQRTFVLKHNLRFIFAAFLSRIQNRFAYFVATERSFNVKISDVIRIMFYFVETQTHKNIMGKMNSSEHLSESSCLTEGLWFVYLRRKWLPNCQSEPLSVMLTTRSSAIAGKPCDAKACQNCQGLLKWTRKCQPRLK